MGKFIINKLRSIVWPSAIFTFFYTVSAYSDTSSVQQVPSANQYSKVRIMCVGDIMTHLPQVQSVQVNRKCKYDFSSIFNQITPIFKNADVVIGNLETVLAGDKYGLSGYPEFNGPQVLAFDLKRVGFTILTTANNHSFDQSILGIKNTIHVLDSAGLLHTGTFSDTNETNRFILLTVNGINIGLLSYTYGTNGTLSGSISKHINLLDTNTILNDITNIHNKKVDIIIASIHFGIEYTTTPTEEQKQIVNFLWRNGVSIIFGHHPHVLQPMIFDSINNRFVMFSLGNFMTNQSGDNREFGAIADLTIIKGKNDSIAKIDTAFVHPTCMYHWYDKSRSRYNILNLETLKDKNSTKKYSGMLNNIVDTISYITRSFHSLDGKFKYGEYNSPDSCR